MLNIFQVIKNSFLYSFSSILLRATSIIFFPVFSYYLTKEDYGILSITQSITMVLMTITTFQIGRGITRFTFKGVEENGDKTQVKAIVNGAFSIVFFTNIIAVGLLVAFPGILGFALNEISFYPYMLWALLALPFTSVFGLFKNYLQANHMGVKVFKLDMLYFGGNIALNLLLVVVFKMAVMGIIVSTFINALVFIVYVQFSGLASITFRINFAALKPVLQYSVKLMPFILFGLLMENTDKIFLNVSAGTEMSGIYYIAITFATIFSTIKESAITAITPWFFKHFKTEFYPELRKIFRVVLWAMCLVAIAVSVYSLEVLTLLSSKKDFVEAWKYIPILVLGLFVVFVGQLLALPIYHSKKNIQYLSLSNILGFVVNLGFSFLLIHQFDILGAAASKLVAFLSMTLVIIVINNRTSVFRVGTLHIVLPIVLTAVLSFYNYLPLSYMALLILKIVLTVFVLALFLFVASRQFGGLQNLKAALIKIRK